MDRQKVSDTMGEIVERTSRECKRDCNNAEQVLLLAKALNELGTVYDVLRAGPNRANRYAFEWYMKAEDERYWNRAKREMKKITVLAVTGTVISGISILLFLVHMFL